MKILKNKLNNKENIFIFYIVFFSFIIKLTYVLFFVDLENPQTYEHGEIARNMYNGYGYSMHWPYVPLDDEKRVTISKPPKYQGAYIPPLNPYFFYLSYSIFGITKNANIFMALLNIIFSCIGLIPIYLISKVIFKPKIAKYSIIISSVFLPNVFGIATFSGSAIYQTIALLFIYNLYLLINYKHNKNIILTGIIGGLLVLIRAEFLFFSIIILISIIFFNRQCIYKNLIVIFIILSISSPWIIRNTIVFNKFITIVSHPWHEFWRGNNPIASGGAYNIYHEKMLLDANHFPGLINKLDSLPYNQNLELAIDSVLKVEVINYWKEHPANSLITFAKRFLITWSLDPYTPRAMNPVYLLFSLLTIISFLFGIYLYFENKNRENNILFFIIISFLILHTLLYTFVNFETRYQIYLANIILPFSGVIPYFIQKRLIKTTN